MFAKLTKLRKFFAKLIKLKQVFTKFTKLRKFFAKLIKLK